MKRTPFSLVALAVVATFCIVAAIAGAFLQPVLAQAPPAANASYKYISTATTTIVRGNSGFLHTVTINGGTAGVVTLFDIGSAGCTGTPASGKFATLQALPGTNAVPVTVFYDLQVGNGICVLTAAATDLTVTYN